MDAQYDERRLWTSRLLAHLVSEETVVLAIDESCFNSTKTKAHAWQPGGRGIRAIRSRSKAELEANEASRQLPLEPNHREAN
jgi:hypothetical protein